MKKYIALGLIVIAAALGIAGMSQHTAQAGQVSYTYDLKGWAWSSNIGWISFNSDQSTAATSQSSAGDRNAILSSLFNVAHAQMSTFKVSVVVTSNIGTFTGYAWSSSIGWIKFGGLSGFPNDPGGVAGNATVNLSTGAVTGWARACGGTATGDCSTMTNRTDGWDGWIELSGTKHASPTAGGAGGVTYNYSTGVFSGKSWGGDVIGWLDFNPSASLGVPPVKCDSCGGSPPPLTVSCSVSPSSLPAGGGSVTATASAFGGTSPMTYAWDWGTGTFGTAGSASSATDPTFTTTGTVRVKVTDSTVPANVVTASCGTVTVASAQPGALTLNIGGTVPTATHPSDPSKPYSDPYPVKKGGTFVLKWTNTLQPTFDGTNGYHCYTTPPNNADSSWSALGQFNDSTIAASSNTGNLATPPSVPTGLYPFAISCDLWSGGTKSSTQSVKAVLKIYSVNEGEF